MGGDISKYTHLLAATRRVRRAEPAMGDTPEDDGPSSGSLGTGWTGGSGSPTELAVQGAREWPNPSSGMGLGRLAKGRSERSGTSLDRAAVSTTTGGCAEKR